MKGASWWPPWARDPVVVDLVQKIREAERLLNEAFGDGNPPRAEWRERFRTFLTLQGEYHRACREGKLRWFARKPHIPPDGGDKHE